MKEPFITIVVAIRNVGSDLRDSLDSFSNQDVTDFEVLIADCESVDDPAQYFAGRSFPIVHVVQADKGIYDAWNRVLPRARGEWVIFMGAGDTFANEDTLAKASQILHSMPDGVLMAYGRANIIGENGYLVGQCGTHWPEALNQTRRFEMFPHQATFQRRPTFNKYGLFDATYRIAGDRDMILRLAKVTEPVYFDLTIANWRFGGTSSSPNSRLSCIREMDRALKEHGISHSRKGAMVKAIVLDAMQKALPTKILHRLIDIYRVVTGRKPRYWT